jgi:hypothetical protein
MKKQLTLLTLCALLFGACKKDNVEKETPKIITVPEQETQQAVVGTPVTTNGISYTEMNQQVAYNKFITLDADKNGQNDFYFTSVLIYHDSQAHMYLMASPVSKSGAKLMLDSRQELVMNGMWAAPLNEGTEISATATTNNIWSNFMIKGVALNVIDHGTAVKTYQGPWVGTNNKYLATQIVINGQVHYGWVKITQTANEAAITITGFAYNTTAGAKILAGQKQ